MLHPNPQRINFDPNKLDKHFAATAEPTAGIVYDETDVPEHIMNLIASLPPDTPEAFDIEPVNLKQFSMKSIAFAMTPQWELTIFPPS